MANDDNDRIEPPNADRPRRSAIPDRASDDRAIDPNDVVPVPAAMEPAEIDARAEAVEALRDEQDRSDRPARARRDDDDSGMRA
jgi:hypothetical protein